MKNLMDRKREGMKALKKSWDKHEQEQVNKLLDQMEFCASNIKALCEKIKS